MKEIKEINHIRRLYTKPDFEEVIIDNSISLIMVTPGGDPDTTGGGGGDTTGGGDEW